MRLCASDEVERPSVCGFFRPRILAPPDLLAELSQEELQQVVIHEMEHLRRGDDWTNLLQKICLVLFPIHPVLLWVERRVCAERELACDDSVLRSSCGRKAYARCLTHLAEHAMVRRGYALVLGAWERRSELVRRVHRILRRPTEGMSAWRAKLVTAGLMAAVLAGTAALARCPQLVSFAPAAESTMQASDVQAARALECGLQRAGFDSNRPKAQLVKGGFARVPRRRTQAGRSRLSRQVRAAVGEPGVRADSSRHLSCLQSGATKEFHRGWGSPWLRILE